MKSNRGFSLLETLLYLAIFAIVGGALFGVLTNVVRISTREISGDEISSQLNFAMTTINRLVRESSNIDIATSTASTTLKLRMSDPAKDPTCITLTNGILKLSQGPDEYVKENCTATSTDLTTNKVVVDTAWFKKVEFPGAHDQVSVDLQFSNTASGNSKISRALRSGIARVSAATFDDNLLPNQDNRFEVGFTTKRWKNISVSELLNLGTAATDPGGAVNGSIYYNTASSTFRGYANGAWKTIGSNWIATPSGDLYNGNSGNVGIGTTTPTTKLYVGGAIRSDISSAGNSLILQGPVSNLQIKHDGTSNVALFNSGGGIQFRDTDGLANLVTVLPGGNVGIGTASPGLKLDVNGTIRSRAGAFQLHDGTTQGGGLFFNKTVTGLGTSLEPALFADGANGKIYFMTGGSVVPKMILDQNGNVGIGTSAPGQKLDVVGNIAATGSTEGTYFGLFKGTGSLPGYPSSQYPTLKTDYSYMYFSAGGAYSAYMNAAGTLTAVSDRDKKENFIPLNRQEVLEKIGAMPMMQWNFKGENAGVRHIAPVAQDFYQAFGLNGTNDRMISNIDPAGVALVGIQGLLERSKEQQKQIDELKAEIAKLKK